MKRRVCFLLLLSVFMCSILTACSGSGGAVSGPNNSYSSGTSQKDQITTSLGWLHTQSHSTPASGSGGYGSNGWGYGESTYYTLETDITIENTGDVTANIDNSLFSAYWDNDKLSPYSSGISPVQLTPGKKITVELAYEITANQYNSWYSRGHNITILIQYGGDSLAYVYSTTTDEITVVQKLYLPTRISCFLYFIEVLS